MNEIDEIKAVVWDVDGVLIHNPVDSEDHWSANTDSDLNIPVELIQSFFADEMEDVLFARSDLKEALIPYLKKANYPHAVDVFLEHWFKNELQLNEAVVQTVEEFESKGLRQYLGSNQEQYRVQYLKKHLPIMRLFREFFYSGEFKIAKPELGFFERCQERIPGVHKHQVLFIDDKKVNAEGAKFFGWKSIHYTDHQTLIEMLGSVGL